MIACTRRSTLALLALSLLGGTAAAQDYPARPIRILVTQPAGAASDQLARILGERMGKDLGQAIVVENRPGAGGNIAGEVVARAAPDGYTLMLASISSHAVNASLYSSMPYDPVKDFAPVIAVASSPNVLVVNTDGPKSVRALIEQARQAPAKYNYASGGNGTSHHLSGVVFNELAGIDLTHVPYKGASDGVAAVMKGEVLAMFPNAPNALPLHKAGRLNILAVTTPRRVSWLPDTPTAAEAGVPGFEMVAWFGIVAPAGTPPAIVTRLNQEANRALADPAVRRRLNDQGFEIIGGSAPEFGQLIRSEKEKWGTVVKKAGLKAD